MSSDTPIDTPLKRAWLKATGAWITVQYDPVPGDDSDYRDIRGNRWRADELEIDTPRTWQSTLAEMRKQVVEVGYKPYRADMLFVLSVLSNHEKQLAALKAENAMLTKTLLGMRHATCVRYPERRCSECERIEQALASRGRENEREG